MFDCIENYPNNAKPIYPKKDRDKYKNDILSLEHGLVIMMAKLEVVRQEIWRLEEVVI